MRGTFKLATFFKIPVRIHWTFFGLVLGYLLYSGYLSDWDWRSMAWSMFFVFTLFFLVVLHEYGHALMARYYKVRTRDIILFPIGGVARLDHIPEKPAHEFWVAIAGPMVNFVLAAIFSTYLLQFPAGERWNILQAVRHPDGNYFLDQYSKIDLYLFFVIYLNLILGIFNLIPAFPMDGGRILRALLSIPLGRYRATGIAVRLGQVAALGMIAYAILESSPIFILISVFILITATNEYKVVKADHLLSKKTIETLSQSHYTPIYREDQIGLVAGVMKQTRQRDFLVFDQWLQPIGVLPHWRIQKALKKKDLEAPVSKYWLQELHPVLNTEHLRAAHDIFQQSDAGALPVYNAWNRLVGVLEESRFNDFLRKGGK
jgi:Zn-dependent protease